MRSAGGLVSWEITSSRPNTKETLGCLSDPDRLRPAGLACWGCWEGGMCLPQSLVSGPAFHPQDEKPAHSA